MMSIALAGFSACSDDDKLPDVKPAEKGSVTDKDGNEYGWVRIGDQLWTTSNAKNGENLLDKKDGPYMWSSYLIADEDVREYYADTYMPQKGNLMTYEDAVNSAPEGWRLPSDEDWKKLEKALGMSDPDQEGFRGEGVAYSLISKDKGPQIGLEFGGACFQEKEWGSFVTKWRYDNAHGYYWTSTINDEYELDYNMAYFRRVTANYGMVSRGCIRVDSYMSVRWVKDV